MSMFGHSDSNISIQRRLENDLLILTSQRQIAIASVNTANFTFLFQKTIGWASLFGPCDCLFSNTTSTLHLVAY